VAEKFGRLGRSTGLRGYRCRKFWEVSKVENLYRSGRSANFGGRVVGKFGRLGRSENLGV
jgi:hypothetical protein